MHRNNTDNTDTLTPGSVASLAHAFADTLGPALRAVLFQRRSAATAANWSNLPQGYLGSRGRAGLRTSTLDQAQWAALDLLLAAATGAGRGQGFDAIGLHLAADDHLAAHGAGPHYGRGNFFVAFLGEPSDDGTWQLQFGGHHLAVSNSYHRGALTGATPSFRGIEPFAHSPAEDPASTAMGRKYAAMTGLVKSLDPAQRRLARPAGSWPDILLGPGGDGMFPSRAQGIAGRGLSPAQRDMLMAAIGEWVHDVDDVGAERILTTYAGQLDRTYLAHSGTTALDRPGDYVRIDGPRAWIEFSMHDGIVLADPHPHTVWRDRLTDYGGPGIH